MLPDHVPAVLLFKDRGETPDIVGDYDEEHYVVKTEPGKILKQNTEAEVLDDLGACLVVKVEDVTGFVSMKQVSKWRSTSGGGSDSGSEGGSSEGRDGDDISLQVSGEFILLAIIVHTGEFTGTAAVLAGGTTIILGSFDRDDAVPLVVDPQDNLAIEG